MLKKRYLFLIIITCLLAISTVSAENNSTNNIISVSNDVNSLEANIVESNMNSIANDSDTLKVSNDEVLTAGNKWYVNSSKTSSGDGKTPETALKTLKEALDKVKDGNTIMVASGEYKGTNNIGLTIDKKLNFIKYGDGEAIFDGYGLIWKVTATSINIIGLTFNGKSFGGAIYFNSSGSVANCTFTGNSAGEGGAIYFRSGGSVANCTFTGNTATAGGGGAIYFRSGGSVVNCTFTGNTANDYDGGGGAIYFNYGDGSVTNCTFTGNTVKLKYSYGGAIYFRSGGSVANCTFTKNTASYNGGAIYFSSGSVANCTFTGNNASTGGAIYFSSGSVANCTFTGNNASTGGAIFLSSGSVANCTFTGNTATNNSGAIYFRYGGSVSVTNCTFTNNTANYGGVIYYPKHASGVSLTNCTFTNNTANYGGVIYYSEYATGGSVTNCTFTENTASYNGGAILFYSDGGSVTNCTFTENTASYNGGAICFYSDGGSVTNCTFTENIASYNGGAICFYSDGGSVTNCAFDNNCASKFGDAIYIDGGVGSIENNWWGSNNPNWNALISDGQIPSFYAVLNVIADPSEIYTTGKSTITTKFVWNGTNTDATNSLPKRNVKLTSNGTLTETEGNVGLNSEFSATTDGIYYVNATVDNEILEVNVKVITPIPTNITVNTTFLDLTLGEIGIIDARLNPSEAGSLTVNYETIISVTQNTDGTWTVTPKSEGNTTIIFSFMGSEGYAPAENKTINVTVKLRDASVSVNNKTLDLNVDDTFEIIATTVPADLKVIYTSNNESVATVDANGKVTAKAKGTAIITATVGGDGIYTLNSTNVSVTVNEKPIPPKDNLTISASAQPITVGEDANVIVTGLEDATGEVTVTIGSNKWTGKISKGTANIVVTGLKETTTANVIYAGDERYNPASTTVKITVNPKPKENLTISASAEPITVGENANVIVTGLKDATGEVTVTVNGKTYTGSIKNSESIVVIPGLTETVTANVNYPDDERYNPASTTVKIVVNKVSDYNITAENLTIYDGQSAEIVVNVPSDATGNILLRILSWEYILPVTDGKATFVISDLSGYSMCGFFASLIDDPKYEMKSVYGTITILPKENLIISASAQPITVGDNANVVVTGLKDATGEVTVTVNGKTYTAPIKNRVCYW